MKGFIQTRVTKSGDRRYDACYRAPDGRQKSKTFAKRKAAERFLAETVGRVFDGSYREIVPITFKAYAERWLEGLGNLKPSTRRAYGSVIGHQLTPAFGELSLAAITVDDVNRWLASREKLRPKTLQNVLGLLSKILNDAHESAHLARNPLAGSKSLRRPRVLNDGDVVEVEILSPAEINRLLDAVDAAHYPVFFTAVCTGARLGELLAFQWGDVDWSGHRLHVRRTAYRGTFYVPKTRQSRRAIDVGDQLLGVLSRLQRERYGETPPPPEALLFPSETGGPLDPDAFRKRVWRPTLTRAALRHVRIHSLRHSYASMLIAQGENLKYISAQLGHTSITMTVDRYGHLLPTERRAATRFEAQLAAASSGHPAEAAEPARMSPNRREHGSGLRAENS